MVEPLSKAQKKLNQRLLAEHSMAQPAVQALWETLRDQDEDAPLLEDSLIAANQQLEYAGLEIVGIHQGDELHLCVMNKMRSDEISKRIGQYPVLQHNFARAVLEHLVGEGATKRSELINLRLEQKPTPPEVAAAEQVLYEFVQAKWLQERPGNQLDLAPRAYAELSSLFTQEFGMDPEELPQQIFYR